MENEKRLIEELREMADRTPPICHYDKPYNTEIFGKQITVYCKPFEQFQELLRRAADALSVDAVEVKHGRWNIKPKEIRPFEYVAVAECSECHAETESNRSLYISGFSMDMVDGIVRREAKNMGLGNYCPNCGAKMDGDGNV